MESARDAYSRINPDSPWRWVPYPTLAMVATTFPLLPTTMRFSSSALVLLAATAFVCWWSYSKIGSSRGADIARDWEAESGGVRVNSFPRLAFAMRMLGPILALLMLVRLVGLQREMLSIAQGSPESDTLFSRYVDTPLLFFGAVFCTLWGWTRPWDLKVVQRDASRPAS